MTDHPAQPDPPASPAPPAAVQPVRDEQGRFAQGNPATVGRPFPPGVSGNPTGRPAGVTYPGDWLRSLSGITESELRGIADDANEPIARRAAARILLDTLDPTPEVRGKALIRVMDRTDGRPRQSIDLAHTLGKGLGIIVRVEGREPPVLPPPPPGR